MKPDSFPEFFNWIMLLYVAVPLVALAIFFIIWLLGFKLKKETVDSIIDVGKWYVISVALVFTTKIIDSGFKDRETGMKEMESYGKYVDIILKSENMEVRWRLAQYFACVTPSPMLRERWEAYQDSLRPDYLEYRKLVDMETELLSETSRVQADSKDLIIIRRKIDALNQKMAPSIPLAEVKED